MQAAVFLKVCSERYRLSPEGEHIFHTDFTQGNLDSACAQTLAGCKCELLRSLNLQFAQWYPQKAVSTHKSWSAAL